MITASKRKAIPDFEKVYSNIHVKTVDKREDQIG